MRLIFAGTPAVALPPLRALLESPHEVVAVVTRPDAPAGRGKRLRPSPVRELADKVGIEVLTPKRPAEPGFRNRLMELSPDAAAVVAYGGLIPGSLLSIPPHGWVNLHFSLLPAWRGAAPVQRAVIAGDETTGACTFLLEEGLDTGPVLGSVRTTIGRRETSGELLDRLADMGAPLLVDSLDALEAGTASPQPQPEEGVSLAPKLTLEDAHLDWTDSVPVLDRRIRGCTPDPGAWTTFRGERLKVGAARPMSDDDPEAEGLTEPGELSISKHSVRARAGEGTLELLTVQPAGKKMMAASDWARGTRVATGERVGE